MLPETGSAGFLRSQYVLESCLGPFPPHMTFVWTEIAFLSMWYNEVKHNILVGNSEVN